MRKSFVILIALVVLIIACKHTVDAPANTGGGAGGVDTTGTGGGSGGSGAGGNSNQLVCFESQVLPIFLTKCATSGCHDATTREKDLVFNSYNGIRFGKSEAIVPFDISESKIYRRITETDTTKRMPYLLPKLPDADVALIKKWIEEGAQNTTNCSAPSSSCNANNFTYSGGVRPILDRYCIGCHSAAATAIRPSFADYAGVQAVAQPNGRLIGAINHLPGFSPMPKTNPQTKLSDCDISIITKWVNAGAPNN